MSISAEMKVFVANLSNDINWTKLPLDDILDWRLINNLEEEVLDLAATFQSDKNGGTTGHLGLIMEAEEFVLIPGVLNPPFLRSMHPGVVNYITKIKLLFHPLFSLYHTYTFIDL